MTQRAAAVIRADLGFCRYVAVTDMYGAAAAIRTVIGVHGGRELPGCVSRLGPWLSGTVLLGTTLGEHAW